MVRLLPAGWFVPVSPGTRQVTVGGAIAADVHGKNHHSAGSFARHVLSFDLLTADGDVRSVTPASDPDLFWGTAGGMGLTGIILRATIQLKAVETSKLVVDTVRTADIDETMAYLSSTDKDYDYTVAWTDCLAARGSLGRSVITSGDFATMSEVKYRDRAKPLDFTPSALIGAPPVFPSGLINARTVALLNEAWFRKAPAAQDRRDPDHRQVLPSAGRDQELEPRLRPGRLPAVPVRGAVRGAGRGAPLAGADQRAAGAVVRHRAQAVRRGRSRDALVPDARLDAGARLPGPHAVAEPAARRARRDGARSGRPALPGQGLQDSRRADAADVPEVRGLPSAARRRSTPAACSAPTCPGAWACEADPAAGMDGCDWLLAAALAALAAGPAAAAGWRRRRVVPRPAAARAGGAAADGRASSQAGTETSHGADEEAAAAGPLPPFTLKKLRWTVPPRANSTGLV